MKSVEFLLIVLGFFILANVAYAGVNTFLKARASKALMENPQPYRLVSDDTSSTLLVLGDSTGVGIGADKPEETVAGRLAQYLHATHVENYAVVGAGVEDLPEQIVQATLPHYDVILVMIGGNNILSFDDPVWAGRLLGDALAELPEAGKVVVMTAGNAGGATIFPHIVRPFHTHFNKRYHTEFSRTAHAWNAEYVNLYEKAENDPFLQNPDFYLSPDGLHPSSEGYKFWFLKLKKAFSEEELVS